MKSDNGNVFISNLWKDVHSQLGVDITYTPPYHPASLGAVERRHRDIKASLQAALVQMANTSGDKWYQRLPWIMLFRRSMVLQETESSPAELALGMTPKLPGDLLGEPQAQMENNQLKAVLEGLRKKAAQPPPPMTASGQNEVYMPPSTDSAEYVFVKRGKPGNLGKQYDGPFKIIKQLGNTSIKIRVGSNVKGEPRFENQHWSNCKVAALPEGMQPATKPRPGRKPLNPQATTFRPSEKTEKPMEQEKVISRTFTNSFRTEYANARPNRYMA